MDVPTSHPRYQSLLLRHRLIDGFKSGLATDSALLAHGRGEAFDYLLGEKTWDFAEEAIAMTSALFLTAKHPVFSVNGNSASLAGEEIVDLTKVFNKLVLEVNLFYYTEERSKLIAKHLKALGAKHVVEAWVDSPIILPGIDSKRKAMNPDGIAQADVVLVAIEDGDRCEALVKAGYTVISVDLNPLSRTARATQVTIVDEIVRTIKVLKAQLEKDKELSAAELKARIAKYDNEKILKRAVLAVRNGELTKS
jgi:4-phosphopantoate--beta-alanine ligase